MDSWGYHSIDDQKHTRVNHGTNKRFVNKGMGQTTRFVQGCANHIIWQEEWNLLVVIN